jgi:hypothetical protein
MVDGRMIRGKFLPAFIKNGGVYHLTDIAVYADGVIYCWEMVDVEGFARKLDAGWVVTSLPEGAEVSLSNLTQFTARDILFRVPESEFLKEVLDVIEELNDRPTSLHKFIQAKKLYWNEPSEGHGDLMLEAFGRVPHHKKKFALNERDKRYLQERGVKPYGTVWELDETGPSNS